MNLDDARAIAETALYEGYVLYPYRASATKNHSRWQFGVVMADSYAALDPTEARELVVDAWRMVVPQKLSRAYDLAHPSGPG